ASQSDPTGLVATPLPGNPPGKMVEKPSVKLVDFFITDEKGNKISDLTPLKGGKKRDIDLTKYEGSEITIQARAEVAYSKKNTGPVTIHGKLGSYYNPRDPVLPRVKPGVAPNGMDISCNVPSG